MITACLSTNAIYAQPMRFALVLALGVAVAFPAVASADVFFKTPSGNVLCQQATSSHLVTCSVVSTLNERGFLVFGIRRTGRTSRQRMKTNAAFEVPVLRYGKQKRLLGGAVVCTSRRSGLTCRNRSRRGFVLSKQQQRRF